MSGNGNGKKNKLLLVILVVVGVVVCLAVVVVSVWGWLLFGGVRTGHGFRGPVAFVCSECRHVNIMREYTNKLYVPLKCEACGKRAAWVAYTCGNCDPEGEKPFPYIIIFPKGVISPEQGMEPTEEFQLALIRAEETVPVCPECNSRRNISRYLTEEDRELIARLREKYGN